MMKIAIQPVILSGGSGCRLWPFSREAYPKQFLSFSGDKTLLQQTLARVDGLVADSSCFELKSTLVVCNEAHRFLVAEQFRQIAASMNAAILEPVGRNTAPALSLAALHALQQGDDPVLLVMPSDHHVQDLAGFRARVLEASMWAVDGALVTFGIVPDKAETGYGYIRKGEKVSENAFELDCFVEKPDGIKAQFYLNSGQYLWNSGLFVLRASVWMEKIASLRPDIARICEASLFQAKRDGDFIRVDKESFQTCPSDSIDYAVMEKLGHKECLVLPLDVGWSDLGSWPELAEISVKDENANVRLGDVYLKDCNDSLVYAQSRFVAALGVSDLMVIETKDALLVARKDLAQDIKSIVEHLKESARQEHIYHAKVHRPWGDYEGIDDGSRYKVKRLMVSPGASLSLQLHHHRAEHWIVVKGTAKVTRGDESFFLGENESTYISMGVRHRLENPGRIPLEVIEVQSGSYLDEDDIVRFDDIYNRIES